MDKVLVVALKGDAGRRRLWEDELVHEMAKHGVTGVASYQSYPQTVPDTLQVAEAIKRDAYDGVMVIFDLAPQEGVEYVPGYVSAQPVYGYPYSTGYPVNTWSGWGPWVPRWNSYYTHVATPGYYQTYTILRDQVDLYSTGQDGRLVWTGVGAVFDSTDPHQVREEVCDRIVPELAEQGIIGRKS